MRNVQAHGTNIKTKKILLRNLKMSKRVELFKNEITKFEKTYLIPLILLALQ